MKNIEFVGNDADFSVHVAQVGDVKFFIVIYIDDLILVCNNKDKRTLRRTGMKRRRPLVDLVRFTNRFLEQIDGYPGRLPSASDDL